VKRGTTRKPRPRGDKATCSTSGLPLKAAGTIRTHVVHDRITPRTYFQLLDYSAISDEDDMDFALRLIREHGVAAIPVTPFLHEAARAGRVLRFCFAKRDDTLARAAERLLEV